MNRAVAIALTAVCAALSVGGPGAGVATAQVPEDQAAKQRRIDQYQERRLTFEEDKEKGTRTLRQGPEQIYDVDFVELMNDRSLNNFWYGERNRDYAYWIGTGVVGVPAGALLFVQNFQGQGQTAFFASAGQGQPANVSDWRTFTLSVAGAALAVYGLYNLSLWALEELDLRHPDRLDREAIAPRVREWNEALQDRLSLATEDIPSAPPTPRPSPTGSASPGASPGPGELLVPSPAVGGPVSYPEGAPPAAVPVPLPVLSPGVRPTGAPTPEPKPRPSVFYFPGASPAASPAAAPSPSPSPKPSPEASR